MPTFRITYTSPLLFILAAVVSVFFVTVSVATENIPVPSGDTVAILTHLSGLGDSPYNQALKECYQKQLPGEQTFVYPKQPENPELLALIACSSAMDVAEKQYWFDIIPQMASEQKERLFDTLATKLRREVDPTLKELGVIGQGLQVPSGNVQ